MSPLRTVVVLITTFWLLYCPTASAQEHDTLASSQIVLNDLTQSFNDAGHYVVRPLHWSGKEWAVAAVTLGMTEAFIVAYDEPIRRLAHENQSTFDNSLSSVGNFVGAGIPTIAVGTILYGSGLATHDTKLRLMGRHLFQSFAYTGMTVVAMKVLVGRERPFQNDGPTLFHGFSLKSAWNSLPSGHCAVAMAFCSTLAADIDNPWATAGLYALGATTVFGRLYADQHWLSDTFLGGLIGAVTGYWVVNNSNSHTQSSTGMTLIPGATNMTMLYTF